MTRQIEPIPEMSFPSDKEVVAALFGDYVTYDELPSFTLTTLTEAAKIHVTGASAINMVNYAISKGLPFIGRVNFIRGLSKVTVAAINGGECRFHITDFVAPYSVNQRKLVKHVDSKHEHISGAIQVEAAQCGDQKIVGSNDVFHILGIAENDTHQPKGVLYYYRPQPTLKDTVSLLDYQQRAGRILEQV